MPLVWLYYTFCYVFSFSFFFQKAAKDNGNIELENKKLEKESKNEQEREKKENKAKENPSMNSASQITVKGLSNLGNTCFFNAVMQVPNLTFPPLKKFDVSLIGVLFFWLPHSIWSFQARGQIRGAVVT